jgi:transposase-like protein
MDIKQYRCKQCGNEFETKIYKIDEAEAKKIQIGPVTCPRCQSPHVEEKRKYY